MSKQRLNIFLSFLICYMLFTLLSLNRHSQTTSFNYHSEIFADKAGYNVYLPSLFIYDFDATHFPETTDIKTGSGFLLDSASQKIITKYPYGVALMQSPFWLAAHLLSPIKDGYSYYYQKSVDFAGSFYLTLGLFFLYFFIKRYQNNNKALALTILIALSTGVFYYGIYETGMSHIYSFCCFSIILFYLTNSVITEKKLLYLLITSLLFIVVRPINAVFLLPIIAFIVWQQHNFTSYLKRLTIKNGAIVFVIASVIVLPQLLYYKYAFGSFFTMSYKNEPFFTATLSRVTELLCSPNNGLFIYYPVIVILLINCFFVKSNYNKLVLGILLMYILIYASWWSLSLGCGFGHRAINDVVLILFLPIIFIKKEIPKSLFVLLSLCALINLKFILSYDTCLHNSLNWNYSEYASILFGELK